MTAAPFSVVICTLDRPEALRRAIQSVLNEGDLVRELWIMDQSADERTREMIDRCFAGENRLRFRRLAYRSKSRAANEAAFAAEGAYLAFTDDDCEAAPGWLAALKAAFDRTPAGGVVAGGILPGGEGLTLSGIDRSSGAVVTGSRNFARLGVCGGGNMAVKTDLFRRLGGLDEAMGPGSKMPAGEDLDFFYRALVSGNTIVKEPAGAVVHASMRLTGAARRYAVAQDYAAGATAFYLKHFRCGDGFAGRGLVGYIVNQVRFHGPDLARGPWRQRAHALALIISCPVWVLGYGFKFLRVPLTRESRRYASS